MHHLHHWINLQGIRSDVKKLLVIIADGSSKDKIQQPFEVMFR